ncbi:MAG TPA: cytochrome c oxidase subunit 3 [Candidatus Acidoferrum sp.]|nr:cytochrome c oxidase subunit 3 [Candidatus Acidoferrum sp.]
MASRVAPVVTAASGAERASRSGIWVGIFAITMSFMAFTSALFVREGSLDWGHLALPSILYLNTLLLLASSGTFELSRRHLEATPGGRVRSGQMGLIWLAATLALGIAFCAGQYIAWQELRAQGVYLATNPNSSFFYVLTFIHVLHVVAGISAFIYLLGRLLLRNGSLRRSFFDNTVIYWHFMGVLWVYLLLLCRMKL